jgi:hypothetical protein
VSLLSQLDHHLTAHPHEPVPAALRAAWRQALDAVANGASLDSALSNGSRRTRNTALGRAAELLAPRHGAHVAAAIVLTALARYQSSSREPRTAVEVALQRALDAGGVPRSRKQIARIIASQSRGHHEREVSTEHCDD